MGRPTGPSTGMLMGSKALRPLGPYIIRGWYLLIRVEGWVIFKEDMGSIIVYLYEALV
jgi:hypothetical protein